MLRRFINWNKTRSGLFVIVAICIVVLGCGTSETRPEPIPAECNLEDIRDSQIFLPYVYWYATDKNPTDKTNLVLYFDHELSDDEIRQIEQLGVTVYKDSWIPPVGDHPWHTYPARCKVEDICKLIGLDSLKRVDSGEGPESYPQ